MKSRKGKIAKERLVSRQRSWDALGTSEKQASKRPGSLNPAKGAAFPARHKG